MAPVEPSEVIALRHVHRDEPEIGRPGDVPDTYAETPGEIPADGPMIGSPHLHSDAAHPNAVSEQRPDSAQHHDRQDRRQPPHHPIRLPPSHSPLLQNRRSLQLRADGSDHPHLKKAQAGGPIH